MDLKPQNTRQEIFSLVQGTQQLNFLTNFLKVQSTATFPPLADEFSAAKTAASKIAFSVGVNDFKPVIKGNYEFSNLNKILPKYIVESLIEAIDSFDKKIKGFNRDDAILAAIESRTSSPVRIERDLNFESNIKGIYPIGEGAGYSGGITTSAMDGLKVVEKILGQVNIWIYGYMKKNCYQMG